MNNITFTNFSFCLFWYWKIQVAQEQEWQNTSENELQEIQHAIHRNLLSRQNIYHMVLYPNREVDIQRDQVFSEHIAIIVQWVLMTEFSL